ncbi:phosphoenolpyruvate phosphomutase, partial [bacterium]|nr:phosphoenolpyruvate phosphomutase [bacterium]
MTQILQHSLFKAFSKQNRLSFLGVGDSISALLATRSGASALWASSLCVSTSLGLRDASELTLAELSRVVSLMRDQTHLPILVDGDSGYGENHVTLRLCKELFRSGASGICLEDKPFPKINSHFGRKPEIVDLGSFCDKLDCIKQSLSKDFFLVARTEAFVANKSVEEGLHRCEAYVEAGADAI